jgi:hypothetical protein
LAVRSAVVSIPIVIGMIAIFLSALSQHILIATGTQEFKTITFDYSLVNLV